MHLALRIDEDALHVTVRDEGLGIQGVSPAANRMGVGLAVISALSSRAEFQSSPGEGTEVRMSFGADGLGSRLARVGLSAATQPAPTARLAGDVVVTVAPAELLEQLFGRLVRAAAAEAHFSLDRFPALHSLTSAITERVTATSREGEVVFAILESAKRLELRIAPLPAGSAHGLFDGEPPPGLDELLERIEARSMDGHEVLEAVLVEPPRPG